MNFETHEKYKRKYADALNEMARAVSDCSCKCDLTGYAFLSREVCRIFRLGRDIIKEEKAKTGAC